MRNTAKAFAFFLAISMLSLAVFAADQPKIIIDSPIEGQTLQPAAIIKFHTENLIIQSPFGKHAIHAWPENIGHLYVTVDENPWHWVHSTIDPVVIIGLSPGVHRVTLEIAGPQHKPIASQSVTFTIENGGDEDARTFDRAQEGLKSEGLKVPGAVHATVPIRAGKQQTCNCGAKPLRRRHGDRAQDRSG